MEFVRELETTGKECLAQAQQLRDLESRLEKLGDAKLDRAAEAVRRQLNRWQLGDTVDVATFNEMWRSAIRAALQELLK